MNFGDLKEAWMRRNEESLQYGSIEQFKKWAHEPNPYRNLLSGEYNSAPEDKKAEVLAQQWAIQTSRLAREKGRLEGVFFMLKMLAWIAVAAVVFYFW